MTKFLEDRDKDRLNVRRGVDHVQTSCGGRGEIAKKRGSAVATRVERVGCDVRSFRDIDHRIRRKPACCVDSVAEDDEQRTAAAGSCDHDSGVRAVYECCVAVAAGLIDSCAYQRPDDR